jgi:hypothetical protein
LFLRDRPECTETAVTPSTGDALLDDTYVTMGEVRYYIDALSTALPGNTDNAAYYVANFTGAKDFKAATNLNAFNNYNRVFFRPTTKCRW